MTVTKTPKKSVTLIEPKRSLVVDKERHRQKRVAAYCRVSTGSEEQLTSYTNQMKVYTEMINTNKEWEFAGMYADEGISGTKADRRPQFQKMIDDCHKGKIDYIITKSVSRFARNTVECLKYVRILKAKGIGIYFEEQNIDTLKSDSELYLVIYAGFAQSESESISKNITWSVRKKFEEGRPIFQYKKLLGYRKGPDGMPEIVPEEAILVERIFTMYLAGSPMEVIADTLKAENHTFENKTFAFSKPMIMNVLRNEKYSGDCILQKTVTIDPIDKVRKPNEGEAPMWLVENSHPAIISREMFNKVQEEMSRRRTIKPVSQKTSITSIGKYSKYALKDVLLCGECGTKFRRVTWTKRGKKKVVWRCCSRLDYGTKYCKDSLSVEENMLKRAIVRAINQFNSEDEATYKMLMRSTIGDALGLNNNSDEVDLLERRIDALNKRMLTLVNESVSNGSDIEEYEDTFKAISEQIEQLRGRIKAIQESRIDDTFLQERLKEIEKTIEARQSKIDEYDESVVRQMIECIKIYKDGRLLVIFGGGYEIEVHLDENEKEEWK